MRWRASMVGFSFMAVVGYFGMLYLQEYFRYVCFLGLLIAGGIIASDPFSEGD